MSDPKGIAQNGTTRPMRGATPKTSLKHKRWSKKSLVKHGGKDSLLQETMKKAHQYHTVESNKVA